MKLTTHSSLEDLLPRYCPITAVITILVVMKWFLVLTCLIQIMLSYTTINSVTKVPLLILHEIVLFIPLIHSRKNTRSTSHTILPSVYH
jgi:hypothetical protein